VDRALETVCRPRTVELSIATLPIGLGPLRPADGGKGEPIRFSWCWKSAVDAPGVQNWSRALGPAREAKGKVWNPAAGWSMRCWG